MPTDYFDFDRDVSTKSAVSSISRREQVLVREGIVTDKGTRAMVDDTVESASSTYSSLDGVPLIRARGRAMGDGNVEVWLQYDNSTFTFDTAGGRAFNGSTTMAEVTRWYEPGSYTVGQASYDEADLRAAKWWDGNACAANSSIAELGPGLGRSGKVLVPIQSAYWQYESTTNPNTLYVSSLGAVNTDTYLGAEEYTLKFVGYSYRYDSASAKFQVRINLQWRPLDGWYVEQVNPARRQGNRPELTWGLDKSDPPNGGAPFYASIDYVGLVIPAKTAAFASVFTGDAAPTYP